MTKSIILIHKIGVLLTIMLILLSISLCTQASSGYIVSLREAPVGLMSADSEAEYIDDTLYKVNSVDAAYKIFGTKNIKACFPDCEMELFDSDYPVTPSDKYFHYQWCHNSIKAEKAREKGLTGKDVKIAVIDSGVYMEHPDFEGVTFSQGYNCIDGAADVKDTSDVHGHGTLVTGVIAACTDNEQGIAGIAGDVTVIPIKITDTSTFSLSMLLKGIKKALETDCDIINMSLGGPITNSQTLAALKEYTDEAEERGITIVAAAGNSGDTDNAVNYPAAFDTVIGVGAVDRELNVAGFSQKNIGVFMCAPGVEISTLTKSGGTGRTSGTSFASPVVAASLALIKQACTEYTPEDMRSLIRNTVVDLGSEGYDASYGHGMLNLENMINQIQNRLPEYVVTQGIKNAVSRIHIHNNTDAAIETKLIFAGSSLRAEEKLLGSGVTNIEYEDGFDSVMLWKNNMKPVVKKYFLK